MKISLPLKLGIFVVLLFAVVIAACLLWTPIRVRYYESRLGSENDATRVRAVNALLGMRQAGQIALARILGSDDAAKFLAENWEKVADEKIEELHDEETPLHLAAYNGYTAVCDLLIAKRASLEGPCGVHMTPLSLAVSGGHTETAEFLIDKGAEVNVGGPEVYTPPIMCAWQNRDMKTFNMLLRRGADINSYSDTGTILHSEVEAGNLENVRFLIDKGADINAEAGYGQPLEWAIEHRHKDLAGFLIEKGADVNAESRNGLTPLHMAAALLYEDIVQALLAAGADVNAMTKNGETPLDLCDEYVSNVVKNMLIKHGGKRGEELRRSTECQVPSTEKEEKR